MDPVYDTDRQIVHVHKDDKAYSGLYLHKCECPPGSIENSEALWVSSGVNNVRSHMRDTVWLHKPVDIRHIEFSASHNFYPDWKMLSFGRIEETTIQGLLY